MNKVMGIVGKGRQRKGQVKEVKGEGKEVQKRSGGQVREKVYITGKWIQVT